MLPIHFLNFFLQILLNIEHLESRTANGCNLQDIANILH